MGDKRQPTIRTIVPESDVPVVAGQAHHADTKAPGETEPLPSGVIRASNAPSWLFKVKIANVLVTAILDTGCNTMVLQTKFAVENKLHLSKLDKPHDIQTAAEGHKLTIDKVTSQRVEVFDHDEGAFAGVASFNFEVAPIDVPCLLGLPFFEAISDFFCRTTLRPHHLYFKISSKLYHIVAMTSARHSKEPDSFARDAGAYAYKNLGKNITRPKPSKAAGITAVSNRRFNNKMSRGAYDALHVLRTAEDEPPPNEPSKPPDWLESTLGPYKDSVFKEPTGLPPDRGKDNFGIQLVPEAQP
ncbi:hypothetical protein HDU88_001117, partial [Geranomyces variabilis]